MSPSLSEVLGQELRDRREAAGRRQEDVTRVAATFGLSWSRPRVVAVEAGTRRLTAEELFLLPAIIQTLTGQRTRLGELLAEKTVDLAPGATATGLYRMFTDTDIVDLIDVDGTIWGKRVTAAAASSTTTLARVRTVVGRRVKSSEITAAERRAGEAERKAAKQLDEPLPVVLGLGLVLWGRTLSEERDDRLGDTDDQTPRTIQARRGRITRNLLAELRDERDRRTSNA